LRVLNDRSFIENIKDISLIYSYSFVFNLQLSKFLNRGSRSFFDNLRHLFFDGVVENILILIVF
jgi:hypothetical protein